MKNLFFAIALTGIVISVFAGPLGKSNVMTTNSDTSGGPVKPLAYESVIITGPVRGRFLDQMERFANQNGFAIRTGSADSDGVDLIVQMWREDFKIIVNNPLEADAFNIGVYPTCSDKVPVEHAETLMMDMLAYIESAKSG